MISHLICSHVQSFEIFKSKLHDVYSITNVQNFMVLSTNYTLSLKVSQINYDWCTFKVAMFYESNAINTFSKFHLVLGTKCDWSFI